MIYFENKTNEELCALYQAGDERALNDLYIQNQRLITTIAKLYVGRLGSKLSLDDLRQVTCMAFIQAAETYDCSQDKCKFSSYFSTAANWRLKTYVAEHGFAVRIPMHLFAPLQKVLRINLELSNEGMDFETRIKTIAKETKLPEDKVLQLIKMQNDLLYLPSLDSYYTDEEEEDSLYKYVIRPDVKSVEEEACESIINDEIHNLIAQLPEKEKLVIKLRFWEEYTLAQVGDVMGVTKERVRQIEGKAIQKLRLWAKQKGLKYALET